MEKQESLMPYLTKVLLIKNKSGKPQYSISEKTYID